MKFMFLIMCSIIFTVSQNGFAEDRPVSRRWRESGNQVICVERSLISNRDLRVLPDSDCTTEKPVSYRWRESGNRVVCIERSLISNANLREVDDSFCPAGKPVSYRWRESGNRVVCIERSSISNANLREVADSFCRRRLSLATEEAPVATPASFDPQINGSDRNLVPKTDGPSDANSVGPRGAGAIEA